MPSPPYQIPSAAPGEGAFSYLQAIRRHRLLVVVVTVVALLAAGLWLKVRSPSYEASSQILVSAVSGSEEGSLLGLDLLRESVDPSRTIQTAASLVESREAAVRAAKRLGAGWTADSVLAAIQVRPEGESSILAVTATAEDPDEAARIANVFSEESMRVRDEAVEKQVSSAIATIEKKIGLVPPGGDKTELESSLATLESLRTQGDPTLSIAQQATPPGEAAGASSALILALALLCGIALGCAASVLLELTNRRVRDEEDAQATWPLPILVRVPKAGRSRRDLGPSSAPEVREAFRGLAVQFDRAAGSRTMLITSPTSGDGKTTAAVNLAVQLAADGHTTILLDFDLRKPDVGRALGLKSSIRMEALAGSDPALKELLSPVPGVPNLTAFTTARDAEPQIELPVGVVGEQLLKLLAEAREMATFVIIDTPPVGEVSDALRWTHLADDVLVVARLGNSERAALAAVRDTFDQLGILPRGFVVIGATQPVRSGYFEQGRAGYAAEPPQRHPASKASSDTSP